LALALPTAALADTIDYGNVGGSLAGSAATGFSITSTLTTIKDVTTNTFIATGPNLGTVVFTTGAVNSSGAFTGGSIVITATGGATLFSGTFSSGTVSVSNGLTFINANLACWGCGSVQIVSSLGGSSGNTIVTPEPGTLGLLGTGLVGLAGIVRRKLRS
jgi:PEP-CTERM motif